MVAKPHVCLPEAEDLLLRTHFFRLPETPMLRLSILSTLAPSQLNNVSDPGLPHRLT